jgi:hypothetical protein
MMSHKSTIIIFSHVHFIYPEELEIKNTTESEIFTSYLDILLNIDSNDRLTTTLYDKHGDCNFAIVNFPFLCSKIPLSSAYGVDTSQLIRYARVSLCCVRKLFKARPTTEKSQNCRIITSFVQNLISHIS